MHHDKHSKSNPMQMSFNHFASTRFDPKIFVLAAIVGFIKKKHEQIIIFARETRRSPFIFREFSAANAWYDAIIVCTTVHYAPAA